jgi:hypothetical protein
MFGKGAILTVFGFILAFSAYQVRMSSNVLRTSDNFNENYIETLIHETGLSAMNLAVNKVWDQNVKSDTFMVVANRCSSHTQISQKGADTVKIKVKTWSYVYDNELDNSVRRADSVLAYFSYNMPLSKYFWFTEDEKGVFWITGDTVWGPVHTNKTIKTKGSPVFYGKVTAFMGIDPNPMKASNKAEYLGGWEVGMYNEIPTDMTPLLNAATLGNGGAPVNTKCIYDKEVTFDFQSDGTVIRTVTGDPPDTMKVTDITPTGVIYSTADVRVKGTFNGQATIYSNNQIWIDDDLVYADNPHTNPNSDDVLGLVARNNIYLTDNTANNSDVHIQAALMSIERSFTAQNYNSRPISGVIYLTGSVCQFHRGPVGTFAGAGVIHSGFLKRYYFDPRFSVMSPPQFPYLKSLRLVAWWE